MSLTGTTKARAIKTERSHLELLGTHLSTSLHAARDGSSVVEARNWQSPLKVPSPTESDGDHVQAATHIFSMTQPAVQPASTEPMEAVAAIPTAFTQQAPSLEDFADEAVEPTLGHTLFVAYGHPFMTE
ncbi:hypothetical protein SPRG_08362 [Saprolegnia parasitica CBS 223.65]|uniref:Uncharacterized protein n=1 Tax=Saprolegnia parasitica (strain CBS 223.65) TaxID=695850 RepID=A0A067CHK4_SAPPC|nr:hypothetical protein SPRG_08362 [Saprolegnia parasitica CBS 223.65]KDO26287.1 hypothetical protein SPRG_08362 [Saprolegnia parasitica CBS 223.65]|eukprot:XP_012202992.1 hypothetical protein SPRG_08362 [Saprolegnia parasitica CBS 223.65]